MGNPGALEHRIHKHWPGNRGGVTISDPTTSATVSPPVTEVDALYKVTCLVTAVTGAPTVYSRILHVTGRATNRFVLNLGAAPGAGTSVTVDRMVYR